MVLLKYILLKIPTPPPRVASEQGATKLVWLTEEVNPLKCPYHFQESAQKG